MYPRLVLLQKLLSQDGAIFISIDDNEHAYLKLICDEIFGPSNYIADISWQRTYSARNDSKGISSEVEHILLYSKTTLWTPNELPRTEAMNSKYKNIDNDVKPWRADNAFAADASSHQTMVYAIQHPFTGKMLYPSNGLHWRYKQSDMLEIMSGWCDYKLENLHDEHERAQVCGVSDDEVRKDIMGIVLVNSLEESLKSAKAVYDRGQWPKYYFSKGGYGGIAKKTYLDNAKGRLPTNYWPFSETGHTDEAKKEILSIFEQKSVFNTPKPVRLIEHILKIASDKDSIVLDSFAGSGTTAHAVMKMNNDDGGNRHFILIEMEKYADSITAQRVKSVINGYQKNPPIDSSFSFYELGPQFKVDGDLNPEINEDSIRSFVFYNETKRSYIGPISSNPSLIGKMGDTAYYLLYGPDFPSVLDDSFLIALDPESSSHVVYAEACYLPDSILDEYSIRFKKIPRDIRGC